jgi:hypothetical protein
MLEKLFVAVSFIAPVWVLHANGLMVLTLAGDHISALTRFDNSVLPSFGLPRTLPTRTLPSGNRSRPGL